MTRKTPQQKEPEKKWSLLVPKSVDDKALRLKILRRCAKGDVIRDIFTAHIDEYLAPSNATASVIQLNLTPALGQALDRAARLWGLDAKALIQIILSDKIGEYIEQGVRREQRLQGAGTETADDDNDENPSARTAKR